MMSGLWALTSSTSTWSLPRTLGSLLVRKTSEVAMSLWRISSPSGVVRSRPRLFLPRFECSRRTWTSSGTMARTGGPRPRMASPRSTCSILMTSAPQSESSAEAAGTNVCSATSRTRTPCMTAVIGGLPCPRRDPGGRAPLGQMWHRCQQSQAWYPGSDEGGPRGGARSRRCAAGDVSERNVPVEGALSRHAEYPFADHIAGHLGGSAPDGGRLAHQEVGPAVGDGAVVVRPR